LQSSKALTNKMIKGITTTINNDNIIIIIISST
jgi:hypothetical protein